MAKRQKYKFAKKEYTRDGISSAIFAGITVFLFLADCMISLVLRGSAGIIAGGIALMAMLFSVYGFYIGLSGFSEKGTSHVFCILGSIVNGIMMVVWLALFLIGV